MRLRRGISLKDNRVGRTTLVKRLTEMHDGTVEACSEGLGKGSEFVIRLPTLDAIPPTNPPSGPDGTESAARRVLVVLLVVVVRLRLGVRPVRLAPALRDRHRGHRESTMRLAWPRPRLRR